MEIRDNRKPKEEGMPFANLKYGQAFIYPKEHNENQIFIKIGFNMTGNILNPDGGWYAVDIGTGDFLFFKNNILITPINAMVVIND